MSELIALHGSCFAVDPRTLGHHVCGTDPPYSDRVHDSAVSQGSGARAEAGALPGVRERDLGFASIDQSVHLRDYIALACGAARRWSVLYSDVEALHKWIEHCEQFDAKYIRTIPWVRWSMPQLSGDRPTTGCEMLSLYWGSDRGKKSWNGPGNLIKLWHDEIDAPDLPSVEHKCLRGAHKHKTEKPLDQALDLVNWFSNTNELWYDPNMGSGTFGVACALLGRDYLGCELDERWALHAKARIERAQAGILSERDEERFNRWTQSEVVRAANGGLLRGLGS